MPEQHAVVRLVRPLSQESLALAEKAVREQLRRQDEDVDEWARRLAADVADAND